MKLFFFLYRKMALSEVLPYQLGSGVLVAFTITGNKTVQHKLLP